MANCGCDEVLDPCEQNDYECKQQIDTQCIFYNLCDEDESALTCIAKPNGTSLKVILEALDAKICSTVLTYNFPAYDLKCLRNKYVINNIQQFSEAVASEICLHTDQITYLDSQITSNYTELNTKIALLDRPNLTDGCAIGLISTDSLKTVLQKMVDKFCNPTLVDISPTIEATNSASIQFATSGAKNHNITAAVTVSPNSGNTLLVQGNGLYVPTPEITIPQVLSIDDTTRVVSLSGGGGSITLPPDLDNQTLSLSVPNKTITITNGNTIDLTPLFSSIVIAETPITPIDTNSINLTVSGTADHTLQVDIKVDGTQTNAFTVSGNGVYVKPEDSIIANNSSTIDFSTSGTFAHTITASVKVDATQPNALTVTAGGLYVQPVTNILSANNGITLSSNTITLGGSLNQNTAISTTGYAMQFTKGGNINNAAQLALQGIFTITGATSTEAAQYPYGAIEGINVFNKSNLTTLASTSVVGAIVGLNGFNQSGNITGAFVGAVTAANNFASTGSFTKVAGFVAVCPRQDSANASYSGTITDYAGIYIQDITGVTDIGAHITNKWGIYQEGLTDKNYFGAPSRFVKGIQIETKVGDPTISDIPTGQWGVWLNTSSGDIKIFANNAGVIESSAALS